MKEPEKYLKTIGLTFLSALDPGRPAVLDAAHRARVNFENYFFADAAERKKFLADPVRYCGRLTDPVTQSRFQPTTSSLHARRASVTYYFESRETRARFSKRPAYYAEPRTEMIDPMGGPKTPAAEAREASRPDSH